ncbi:MAG TPA: hypothetical protein VK943_16270 [Arenibaculum sp.]|nr:hypothetical protein [Arenibaculum sp.]
MARLDPRRGSISALALYFAGGIVTVLSMTLLLAPTETSFGPGLVGTGLGIVVMGVGRVVGVLTEVLEELRDLRSSR